MCDCNAYAQVSGWGGVVGGAGVGAGSICRVAWIGEWRGEAI